MEIFFPRRANMQFQLQVNEVAGRLKQIIDRDYGGNLSRFGRACQKVNSRINRGNVASLVDRRSVPKLDTVAVMAVAAGVSLDWLAGIKTPHPEEPDGATLEGQARGAVSVQLEPVPSQAVTLPGFAIGAPGSEQLIIDFLVLGKRDRRVIPFGEHVPNGNKEGR